MWCEDKCDFTGGRGGDKGRRWREVCGNMGVEEREEQQSR